MHQIFQWVKVSSHLEPGDLSLRGWTHHVPPWASVYFSVKWEWYLPGLMWIVNDRHRRKRLAQGLLPAGPQAVCSLIALCESPSAHPDISGHHKGCPLGTDRVAPTSLKSWRGSRGRADLPLCTAVGSQRLEGSVRMLGYLFNFCLLSPWIFSFFKFFCSSPWQIRQNFSEEVNFLEP